MVSRRDIDEALGHKPKRQEVHVEFIVQMPEYETYPVSHVRDVVFRNCGEALNKLGISIKTTL